MSEDYRAIVSLTEAERLAKERQLASLLRRLEELRRTDLLGEYRPGGIIEPTLKQIEFHTAGATKRYRMLSAANQSGKTLSCGMEVAMHITGRYPEWWQGHRFETEQLWWVGGVTGESTRDNPQRILLGLKRDWGTGTVPKDAFIGAPMLKRGVPDAVDSFQVRWGAGGDTSRTSTVWFKSYDQEREKWQGATLHGVWMDEEPPYDIYEEAKTRLNYHRGIMPITFTPLLGMTEVCQLFYSPRRDDAEQAQRELIVMDLHDASFYSKEQRDEIEASYSPAVRRARVRGLPALGEGLIYDFVDEDIIVEPFPIPEFYRRIIGLDFGIDHPTAAVFLAYNADTDIAYIYNTYREVDHRILLHARALVAMGADKIPVAWPADGLKRLPQRDTGNATPMKDLYVEQGVKMMPYSARYDVDKGGPQALEPIIEAVYERLASKRLKVFSTEKNWLEEKNIYHRKGGKPVPYRDDLLSATHYAVMMLRYARAPYEGARQTEAAGDYDPLTYQSALDGDRA